MNRFARRARRSVRPELETLLVHCFRWREYKCERELLENRDG